MTLWLRGLIRSCDKLKSLYFYYHSAYGHQIWQDGNLRWWASENKVIWPFDQVVLRDQVATWSHIIFPLPQCIWPPNLASWWLVMRGFHPYFYFILWSPNLSRSRGKLKSLHLHYHNIYGLKIKQKGDLPWLRCTHKAIWPYNLVVLWDHMTN